MRVAHGEAADAAVLGETLRVDADVLEDQLGIRHLAAAAGHERQVPGERQGAERGAPVEAEGPGRAVERAVSVMRRSGSGRRRGRRCR